MRQVLRFSGSDLIRNIWDSAVSNGLKTSATVWLTLWEEKQLGQVNEICILLVRKKKCMFTEMLYITLSGTFPDVLFYILEECSCPPLAGWHWNYSLVCISIVNGHMCLLCSLLAGQSCSRCCTATFPVTENSYPCLGLVTLKISQSAEEMSFLYF